MIERLNRNMNYDTVKITDWTTDTPTHFQLHRKTRRQTVEHTHLWRRQSMVR